MLQISLLSSQGEAKTVRAEWEKCGAGALNLLSTSVQREALILADTIGDLDGGLLAITSADYLTDSRIDILNTRGLIWRRCV